MSWLRLLVMCGLALALPACTVQTVGKFDAAQLAFATSQLQPGTGRVVGQAFVHSSTGRTYTAAGDTVSLVPATAYAEERMKLRFGSSKRVAAKWMPSLDTPDPDYARLHLTTKVEMGGRFTFEDVKPGRWLLLSFVQWERGGLQYAFYIAEDIQVKAGETTKVILSGN